jgi:hypothetical protein
MSTLAFSLSGPSSGAVSARGGFGGAVNVSAERGGPSMGTPGRCSRHPAVLHIAGVKVHVGSHRTAAEIYLRLGGAWQAGLRWTFKKLH